MKWVHMAAYILVMAGALNWLLVGAFQWDVSMLVGGPTALLPRVLFVVIGLAGVYVALTHKKECSECASA